MRNQKRKSKKRKARSFHFLQCWQYLVNQHFEGGEIGEATTAKYEVVNTEFDEWAHLFDDLSGSTNKGVSRANAGCVQGPDGSCRGAANTAAESGSPQRGRIAIDFSTHSFALGYLLSIIGDACPGDVPPMG